MHFQTNRIKMKILISLSVMALVLAGCTSAKHQQMQNERDTRREAYEDVRRKETFKHSRDFLSDDMLGKWRFLELVVEERGGSEDVLKVKAARTERRLKGLRLRFWKSGDTAYQYQIENMMSKTHGTYTTRTVHRGINRRVVGSTSIQSPAPRYRLSFSISQRAFISRYF